jgi:hypothetical protein
MEQQKKTQDILNELNKGKTKPVWVALEGFHALTVAQPPASTSYASILESLSGMPKSHATFNPGAGLIVKTFFNTATGEVKTYYYKQVTN